MRIVLFVMVILMAYPAFAEIAPVAQQARAQEIIERNNRLLSRLDTEPDAVRIKKIVLNGIKLRDKESVEKIIKPRQNKKLTKDEIEKMIDELRVLYWASGYAKLVDITYILKRNVLTIQVDLLNH